MLAKTHSCGMMGIDAYPVTIEIDVSKGFPSTTIVGLPDNAIKESKERIRSAIKNSGFKYGPHRAIINLAPADIKKEGPSFDLAMAIGLLVATEQVFSDNLSKFCILGELSLDGNVQPIKGALPSALSLNAERFDGLILPESNILETALSNTVPIFPVKTLNQALQIITQPENHKPFTIKPHYLKPHTKHELDFQDVKGQLHVKRGLEIAATGGHNVLMIGPPGSGKSMLAKRIPTILPNMSMDECLETTKIHSIMGYLKDAASIITTRPFRSPHHTTSSAAIIGGGTDPHPGEVTLSHNGVLFLDELPEFSRTVLESLRQPLEDRCVTIARTSKTVSFPANFMLICTMNPCPCGFFMDPKKECHCSPIQIQKYMSRISGPLLDRIDLHLEVPALPSATLLSPKFSETETSEMIQKRVLQARAVQVQRFSENPIETNTEMNQKQLKIFCKLNKEGISLIKQAIDHLGLSARAYDKILRISRTIADLESSENISPQHIAEAIQYRSLDRNWWG